MKALCIILFLIALLLWMPIRTVCEYGEDGFFVYAGVGTVKIQVFPLKNRKKKRKKEKKPEKQQEEPEEKKPGSLKKYLDYIPVIKDALGRLRQKLTIEKLYVYYLAAAESSAAAALQFGTASAAFGMIIPFLENNFKVKKRDFAANVSFEEKEPKVYLSAQIALRIGSALYVVLRAISATVKIQKRQRNENGR